jgi:hypothetical protein
MRIPGRGWTWGLWVVIVAGCTRASIQPPGTGAKKAVQSYYEALVRRDWEKAYSVLDADSKARCTQEQFSQLAPNYRSRLGFEPDAVHVQTCDEQQAEATAHVVLTGRAATKDRRYKDAITLRRDDQVWHVVLPENFGQAAAH